MKHSCLIILYSLISLFSKAQAIPANDTSKVSTSVTDSIYKKPETEATFKKGNWLDFLQNHMTYPKEAMKNEIQGVVVVQFVIETDGSVSNIAAIEGPVELRDDAVHLIMKSPKWIPAIQDGQKVRSYKKQPIVYRLTR
jgi:periplasmic protein TonB